MSYKSKINALKKILNEGLLEKEEAISLSLLCLIAGKSIFLYGSPGSAKSLVARRVSSAFKNHKFFDYLMNRFSTPEEIFGPLSLENLRKDKLVRKTCGFLPSADFAFLDEIWKSSPAILNSLLTIINEKKFRNILASDSELNSQNLSQEQLDKVPLKGLIAASNELPAKGQSLEALFDRFIIRLVVPRIESKANFRKLLQMRPARDFISIESNLCFSDSDLDSITLATKSCEISNVALDALVNVKDNIESYNRNILKNESSDIESENAEPIDISERRWINIMELLRFSAILSDRECVELVDLALLRHCLWSNLEQIPIIDSILSQSFEPFCPSVEFDSNACKRLEREIIDSVTFGKMQDIPSDDAWIMHNWGDKKPINKHLQKILLDECENLKAYFDDTLEKCKAKRRTFKEENSNIFISSKDYNLFFQNLVNIESNIAQTQTRLQKLKQNLKKAQIVGQDKQGVYYNDGIHSSWGE
ncbi:AAA domain-containing protein [Helicobacter saguini]|uniref:AAA domain-containing protein n=1 Tax=Helicobacter saguini TaxID=1548018 RepID=A0A347VH42_9HELI|nr:AAA family ATPase [Helicobacter saguini]MWV62141.1 AAA domain-containing protein [Helicobacter saguini]MWV67187.1 AAA domain-containing protein [Helicobacter saguini]MWV69539.1 AAA domain-containing protein [Helicobacter saguini]MWV70910.1 AAA domain-containing protein [Helicobacter saguini]TLD92547.1 hypothetical protein LS64_010190 [Helicobacter saguini]